MFIKSGIQPSEEATLLSLVARFLTVFGLLADVILWWIIFSDFRLFVLFNKKFDLSLSPEVEITQIFKNSLLNYFSITTRFMYMYMPLTFQLQ